MMTKIRHHAVVLLSAEPAWLALSREERNTKALMGKLVVRNHEAVRVRWIDSDALGGRFTDMLLCEMDDLWSYHKLMEELRDTELFHRPYFRIVDVHIGLENAYEAYERELPG
jgi:hypothetical protein